jgi:hypothetical protein
LVAVLNLSWAQELTIIMFVWMAKFGAAYGVRTGIHVGVDVLINRLDDRMRSKFIIFGLLAGALFTGIVGTLGGHFVWENGAHYAFLHMAWHAGRRHSRRPDHARPRVADLDRLFGDSAGQQPDVFPLPAGDGGLHQDRRTAAPRPRPRRRSGGAVPPVDVDVLSMDDNLHMHDLRHTMVGDNRRKNHIRSIRIAARTTLGESRNECHHHFPDPAGAHADRHADLDFARPDRTQLPLHVYPGTAGVGGPEAVHRHREVRDHGHSRSSSWPATS